MPDGTAAYFLCANRGKKSLTVDIAKPEGQEIVRRLAADADVLIENYKVGGLAKYGLDYASLAELNPRLVYCSVTGFGQDGPYAQMAGYDYIVQGMSGLMSITGPADGEPHKVGWRSPTCSPDSTPPTRSRPRCGRGKAAGAASISTWPCSIARWRCWPTSI